MAYNRKAWEITVRHFPAHTFGISGPCCFICQAAYKVADEALRFDDTDMDGTDFAHPAWWRGHEYSFARSCREINDILDGKKANVGTATSPWQQLRQRLYDIRTLLGLAERVINTVHMNTKAPGMCQATIMQWFKVRRDYAERLARLTRPGYAEALDSAYCGKCGNSKPECHCATPQGDPGDEHGS